MTKPQMIPEQQKSEQSAGNDPKWIKDMQEHFLRTGAYRAEDLQRLLGDPRDHVELKATGSLPFNFTAGN